MAKDFEGKVVVVTGGSRGIGFAAVKAFLAEGAKVCFLSHYEETGAKALAALREISPDYEVLHRVIDLCDWKAAQALFEEVNALWGHVDVLINNAGVDSTLPTAKLKQSQWDEVMDVNVKAVFNMTKYAAKYLKKSKGCVVNLASVAGIYGAPTGAPYPVSKAGVEALTKSHAWEYAPTGVRVNCVAPGVVNTDLIAGLPPFAKRSIAGSIPLRRWAEPEEIARVLLFLASDYASYITGVTLQIDGGYVPSNTN